MLWHSKLGSRLRRIAQAGKRAKSATVLSIRCNTETVYVYLFLGVDSAYRSKLFAHGKAQDGCKEGY